MEVKSIVLNVENNPEACKLVFDLASVLKVDRAASALSILVLQKAPEFISQLKAACQQNSEGAGA